MLWEDVNIVRLRKVSPKIQSSKMIPVMVMYMPRKEYWR